MTEKRINLQGYAMNFGTFMGVYWIAKFVLFPLGFANPLMFLLFIGLTIAVPFIGYRYAKSFRDKVCGGSISFMQAWIFMIFMYLFASLLVAVAHYIYLRYIDNGYIIEAWRGLFENSQNLTESMETMKQYQLEVLKEISTLTPIEITMQLFSSNMLNCSILALITAPFVVRKKQVTP